MCARGGTRFDNVCRIARKFISLVGFIHFRHRGQYGARDDKIANILADIDSEPNKMMTLIIFK